MEKREEKKNLPKNSFRKFSCHNNPIEAQWSPSLYPTPVQDEPLSLVKKDKVKESSKQESSDRVRQTPTKPTVVSVTGARPPAGVFNVEALIGAQQKPLPPQHLMNLPSSVVAAPDRIRNDSGSTTGSGGEDRGGAKQRNYKNMTRERRVEANARERQRVHTITAAFDNLQGAIPTDDDNTKLSKLSVIKIATAYIMALSRMAGHDYTEDQSAPPVEEVIAHCSKIIEEETRTKKRSGACESI